MTARGSVPPRKRVARAIVPASTANLGPGFDSLGMALPLYAGVSMRAAGQTDIRLFGENLDGIPLDKSNLVYEVAQAVFRKAGVEVPELEIAYESNIPLTRGLGSSAAAIVGSLVVANGLIGEPLSRDELFQMATALERHPDNVGASLYGGFVAAAWDGEHAAAVSMEPPADLEVLVAIPEFELSTKKARGVLPQQVSMEDAVFNVSHSSLLTAALVSGRLDVLRHAMRDRLHQPYRASMIPGMADVLRDAPDHGALGAVLSGAGPTLLMLADRRDGRRAELEGYVKGVMQSAGVGVSTRWLKPCAHGALLDVSESDRELEAPLAALAAPGGKPEVRA
ncbi:homoserine kinase [Cohnella sp. CFH 77786]|uniref:homoserine kinase n=1 Tax=Cohnella sp. CFH 77786 TaxID=2662265 RepID=UPI001C60CDA8|nr:homoserine kinase [Cohnella sp. CFH 77786]MBW5447881.1 homoserine kinase [Cohnella sp. CFH 77786]